MSEANASGRHAAPDDIGDSPTRIASPELAFEAKRAFIWTMTVGAVVLAVYLAKPLLVIFGAMVLAAMIDGGARLLGHVLKIPRSLRVAIVLLAAVGFFVWLGFFAGSQIAAQASELPGIVQKQVLQLASWAQARGVAVDPSMIQNYTGQIMSGVGTLTRALGGIFGGLTTVMLITIIGIYLALEPQLYERGVAWMLPRHRRDDFFITTARMAAAMRRLMGGRVLGMVFEGIFTFILLAWWGVPMAALLAIITGLLAFIPNLGALISGVLMVLVGFSDGANTGLYTIFVYFFVQTFDGYVVIPLIAKKTVDLAPALVLSAQLVMGILFGILGLFLADPMIAMLKVALERRAEGNRPAIAGTDAQEDEAAGGA